MHHKSPTPPPHGPLQMDNHNGNLSVEETLLFAFACQFGTNGTPNDLSHEIARARKKFESAGGGEDSFQAALQEVCLPGSIP